MEKHKLRARVHKCRFLQDSVDYLGYIVGNGIVKPDPKKTDAITTWKLPRTITELRSFLGMAQQLHRFIPNHAEHTAPFTDYLRGSPKKTDLVAWTPAMIESFESLKQHLASNVATLIIQDPDEPIYLHTDWSLNALGGWIGQQCDGQISPIAFESHKLKPSTHLIMESFLCSSNALELFDLTSTAEKRLSALTRRPYNGFSNKPPLPEC